MCTALCSTEVVKLASIERSHQKTSIRLATVPNGCSVSLFILTLEGAEVLAVRIQQRSGDPFIHITCVDAGIYVVFSFHDEKKNLPVCTQFLSKASRTCFGYCYQTATAVRRCLHLIGQQFSTWLFPIGAK